MVEIVVVLDGSGCLSRFSLKGHAGYHSAKNRRISWMQGFIRRMRNRNRDSVLGDPACAAVTLMARTVARVTASREGWTVDGAAPEPGNLFLVIERRPEDTDEWLHGVTDTLMQALADIDEEFPDAISVSLEEKHNGS